MQKANRKRAATPKYVSPNQLSLEGFESPFERTLNPQNRWVVLAHLIPWDEISSIYLKHNPLAATGRPPLSPRVIIGSIIIKHLCNLDDSETVAQISENIYMQYFIGYSSFSNEPPFDDSLLTDFRKRLGIDQINAINERIMLLKLNLIRKKSKNHHMIGLRIKMMTSAQAIKETDYGCHCLSAGHCLSDRSGLAF